MHRDRRDGDLQCRAAVPAFQAHDCGIAGNHDAACHRRLACPVPHAARHPGGMHPGSRRQEKPRRRENGHGKPAALGITRARSALVSRAAAERPARGNGAGGFSGGDTASGSK